MVLSTDHYHRLHRLYVYQGQIQDFWLGGGRVEAPRAVGSGRGPPQKTVEVFVHFDAFFTKAYP